ncbi:MAG TPA: SpvB/TcaC N-terminal domain-containing protein [Pyrinomonadaceae bacterium]
MPPVTPATELLKLPQGGGALQGLGEKFTPDLFTGTGNFTLPIQCPAGRNGLQPQLNLTYSTGHGNGPFGLGWALNVPGVTRQTSKGIPRYNQDDTFVLSGTEDLIPVSSSLPNVRRYRPRTEGLFASIQHLSDPSQDCWEVRTKDGLVSVYGSPGQSTGESAVVKDPHGGARIFCWKLTATTDLYGNRIEYGYRRDDPPVEGPPEWDQLYLQDIRYVEYTENAQQRFLYHIRFVYEQRPDPFSDYRAGFEVRTALRCCCIEVLVDDGTPRPDGTPRFVRRYEFSYDGPPEDVPPNGASLLRSIRVVGYDDAGARGGEELPPIEFRYAKFAPEQSFGDYHRDLITVTDGELPALSLTHPDVELVDLFGNGLPDILETGLVQRYWSNRGEGSFARPRVMDLAPTARLSDPGVQLLDADGDGRADLLVLNGALPGYYPLTFAGEWDRRSLRRYENPSPGLNFADPEVRLIDLDGDGLTDVLRSGSRFECFFNHRRSDQAWRRVERHERRALEDFPNVSFSDPRVRTADMTGDGLQDIVFIHERSIEYWPNLGHGRWGKRVRMSRAPELPFGYDPRRVLLGDLDGDGAADLVYAEDGRILLWVNQSGNGWSERLEISATPPTHDQVDVRVVDFLGSGTAGILWSYDAGSAARAAMYFLDLTGGAKPYLLQEMNNNMGAVTRVRYAPSTRFFLEDETSPQRRWRTKLPFPVQVVAQVEVLDEISRGKLSTQYHYRHGYWDGVEREFRGFACVEQRDTETFEDYHRRAPLFGGQDFERFDKDKDAALRKHFTPPTLTRTWFHLGALDENSDGIELDLSDEYWPGDGPLLQYHQSPDSLLSSPGLQARDKRDAVRTLRGSVLRTERYALDDSPRQDRPYTVAESCYSVREVAREDSPPQDEPPRLIAFPHLDAQRTTRWERGDDPLTIFTFNGDYDAFGQRRQQTTVAFPRRADRRVSHEGAVVGSYQPDEKRVLTSHTRTSYAASPSGKEIHNRVAQVKAYELNAPPVGPDMPSDDAATALRKQYASAAQIVGVFETMPANAARVFSHVVNHYDGEGFEGLPIIGQLGDFGALTRVESLSLTDAVLQDAYDKLRTNDNRRPDYLGGTSARPAEAPAGFGTHTGYIPKTADPVGYEDGWYVNTQCVKFDFQDGTGAPRGVVVAVKDALGHETSIRHDRFSLLPIEVTDSARLTIKAEHNYRVQQPARVEDPNGTSTHLHYSPLGLPQRRFVRGLDATGAQVLGGSEGQPELEYEYGFRAFVDSPPNDRKPTFVHTRRRVHHASDSLPDETIETWEYSDGFGRLIQTRTQAEEWVFGASGDDVGLSATAGIDPATATAKRSENLFAVSGWQKYDNKGRVIEKYEPFFSEGREYQPERDARRGEHLTMFYDPRGNVVRTRNPDGSEQRIILGRPRSSTTLTLDDLDLESADVPDSFEPSPWETYTYDSNDLSKLTHAGVAGMPADHWFTPASSLTDALGRVLCLVQRNGGDPSNDWFVTRTDYDLRGNALRITDAHGRTAFTHRYDLLNRPLAVDSIDAGLRTKVPDALGSLIEYRDSKGSIALRTYDGLNRPKELWARDDHVGSLTLRERIHYGDEGEHEAAKLKHTLGRAVKYYDEAGLLETPEYDFKGNPLERIRRTIKDDELSRGWVAAWESEHAEDAIETTAYQTSSRYDALNRPIEITCPQDVEGGRKRLTPRYNRAGALEAMSLDGVEYVERIAYNAKGQRILIAYGNDVMTRHAYDPKTFRLSRLRTERFTSTAGTTAGADGAVIDTRSWDGGSNPLQDFTYAYDPAGNITTIDERTPNCGYIDRPGSQGRNQLTRQFTYDPIYRLLSATGRTCRNTPSPRGLDDDSHCGFYAGNTSSITQENAPDLTECYRERYSYDPAGNMLKLWHQTCSATSRKRVFGMGGLPNAHWRQATNNRLTTLQDGTDTHSYQFDDNGNLTQQNSERKHNWDHADRMVGYRVQPTPTDSPSVEARYLYGADGMRVKKWVRNQQAQVNTTVYVDGLFEHHRQSSGGDTHENNTLHMIDNQSRIALVRVGAPLDATRDASPQIQYHLGDHLGSSHVVVGGTDVRANSFINREEYLPYGETSFGSYARKRYRFGGKERDEESGFYYFGARYLAPLLSRWISCDPLGRVDGLNAFIYGLQNPLRYRDPTGQQNEPSPQDNAAQQSLVAPSDVCGVDDADTADQPAGSSAPPNNIAPASKGVLADLDAGFRAAAMNQGIDFLQQQTYGSLLGILVMAGDKRGIQAATDQLEDMKRFTTMLDNARPVEPASTAGAAGGLLFDVVMNLEAPDLGTGTPASKDNSSYNPPTTPLLRGRRSPRDAAALADRGMRVRTAYPSQDRHHIFPKEHQKFFQSRDIDIDQYTAEMSRGEHSAVHTMGWNSEWKKFMDANPGATEQQVFEQAGRMMDKYKLNKHPLVPYQCQR